MNPMTTTMHPISNGPYFSILLSRADGDLTGTFEIKTFKEQTRSHEALVYYAPTAGAQWAPSQLAPGQKLGEPKALFKKLDESEIAKQVSKLGRA